VIGTDYIDSNNYHHYYDGHFLFSYSVTPISFLINIYETKPVKTQDTMRRQTKLENKSRSNMDHTNNQKNICPSMFSSIVVDYSHI
jgi:hypothetical protein